jgi:hypothetical protein
MQNKIEPFIRKTIDTALGMEEEDLSNAVVQQVRDQSPAEALLETLEPVRDSGSLDISEIKLMMAVIDEGFGRRCSSGCQQYLETFGFRICCLCGRFVDRFYDGLSTASPDCLEEVRRNSTRMQPGLRTTTIYGSDLTM